MVHSKQLRLLAVIAMLSVAFTSLAAVIRGIVTDDLGEPLGQDTVRLLTASDSSFVTGGMTGNKGRFALRDIRDGKYILETTFLGLATDYRNVNVKGGANVRVDTIRMRESSIMLKGVTVTGAKTQIKVMEDTVEFAADTYKTQPNAVVEDLLKRLPGVEVDTDGKITANGQEVKKILIDGKEFFSDDPKVASKNLPVNMVDKLQVVNRKSDLARLTGVDDGEDETVINLTVKPGMRNGYFGTAEAGYGTDHRYLGSFNINRFWNDNQVTLLGNLNNINELGFTDSNGNRFRRFGGTNGINTSKAIGLNFNVGRGEILRVGGDVMYSYSDRDTHQLQERQYLFTDSTSYSHINKLSRDKGHNLRGDFRLEWKPDSFNTLDFRPNFSFNRNDSYSIDSTLMFAGDPRRSPVSSSLNDASSDGKSFEFGARLIYNHNFKHHRGRSFSVQLNYSHSNVRENERSYSHNIFWMLDSLDVYDQLTDNHTWSDQAGARLTWTEPLGDPSRGNFLTFSYNVSYRWNNADKMVYDHPVTYPDDIYSDPIVDYMTEIFNDSLSNRFRNEYFNQNIRLGYKYVSSRHNLDVGLSLVPQMSKSINLINDAKTIPTRWVWNVAPFLRYRLKMSKTRSMNIFYHGRSSQPTMAQMQPVADKSDPMNVIQGNPSLDPTFSHNIRFRFQDFNSESQRSMMINAHIQMVQNSIVSRTTFDRETGGRFTTYENVNGVWSAFLMNMFSMPLRNKAWQFSNHLFANLRQNIGYNNGERNRSNNYNFNLSPGIAFRPENFEFEIRPRYNIQITTNTLSTSGDMVIHNYGGMMSAYYYTPFGLVLNTDLNYTATRGYASGYDKNEWMWNASISYQTLRDRSLTFSLKAYDLLQQRSNISRSVTANYIDDTSYNNLTRYFMFTVSYRFNTFGKGNEPHGRFGGPFGHGGPPPGGRPRR